VVKKKAYRGTGPWVVQASRFVTESGAKARKKRRETDTICKTNTLESRKNKAEKLKTDQHRQKKRALWKKVKIPWPI